MRLRSRDPSIQFGSESHPHARIADELGRVIAQSPLVIVIRVTRLNLPPTLRIAQLGITVGDEGKDRGRSFTRRRNRRQRGAFWYARDAERDDRHPIDRDDESRIAGANHVALADVSFGYARSDVGGTK